MPSLFISWLLLAVLFELIGTSLLIKTQKFKKLIPSIIVVTCYLICFFTLSKAMAFMSSGLVYAMWCGFGIILITLVDFILYKQKPNQIGIVGILLIVAGIITMGVFK